DAALKYRMGLIIQHSTEHFTARAIRNRMINHEGSIAMTAAAQQVEAVSWQFAALACEGDEALIAADSRALGQARRVELGLRPKSENRRGDVRSIICIFN